MSTALAALVVAPIIAGAGWAIGSLTRAGFGRKCGGGSYVVVAVAVFTGFNAIAIGLICLIFNGGEGSWDFFLLLCKIALAINSLYWTVM